MLEKKTRLYEKPMPLMKFFSIVCALVMLFNFVLITCDVFMRFVFKSPIQGATEIVTMLMAWVAYAGLAYTMSENRHMQLGAVYDRLHGRKKHVMSFIIYAIATLMFCIFVVASWKIFWVSWEIHEKAVAAVTVYVFIGKFGTFVGWTLLAIQSAFMMVYSIQGIRDPENVEPIGIVSEIPDEEELSAFEKEGEKR